MAKKTEEKAPEVEKTDLSAEFAELGRAMREAVRAAWQSEERNQFQNEIRSGLNKLADEMEAAARSIRDTDAAQQVETAAKQMRDDARSGKVGEDVRKAVAQALRTTRDAIDSMADSFTPAEDKEVEFEPLDMERAKSKGKGKAKANDK